MGLEFNYNVFIHLKGGDRLTGADQILGCVTGRKGNFLHFAGCAKWLGFERARHVFENVQGLSHSFGFFSLTADYRDCRDRDRAYLLNDGRFCEVNTRTLLCREETPPGLYEHFAWCREEMSFEECSPLDRADLEQTVTVAGWMRGGAAALGLVPPPPEIEALFDEPGVETKSVALLPSVFGETYCSLSRSAQACFGEEDVLLKDVLLPMLEVSKKWPVDGILFLLGRPTIPQIVVSAGRCFPLAPLEPPEWTYHSVPAWTTGNHGYDKR
jgi:hypothetical protein